VHNVTFCYEISCIGHGVTSYLQVVRWFVAFVVSCILDVLISRLADSQLRELLGEVLAIPNADTLPTPNARKTCALAIWVIQVQRLSRPILQPLAFRIAHVIRRGIDGELGKEGKKGSASDGLKVRYFTCFDINELTKIRLSMNFRSSNQLLSSPLSPTFWTPS